MPGIRFRFPLAAALALAVALPGGAAPGQDAGDGRIHPERWPQVQWPLPPDPALERQVEDLLSRMSLEEKVGQVVQGDIASITPEDVRRYRLGSILAGGSYDPGGRYNAPPAD